MSSADHSQVESSQIKSEMKEFITQYLNINQDVLS